MKPTLITLVWFFIIASSVFAVATCLKLFGLVTDLDYLAKIAIPGITHGITLSAVLIGFISLILLIEDLRQNPIQLSPVSKVSLPGGTTFEFQDSQKNELSKAQTIIDQFEIEGLYPQIEAPSELEESAVKGLFEDFHRVLRVSLVGLDLSVYKNLIEADPRMGIRAFRIGMENVYRNRLMVGSGIYIPGEDIYAVLVRLKNTEPDNISPAEYELAKIMFGIIDAADAGHAYSCLEAISFLNLAVTVRASYVKWLFKKAGPKNTVDDRQKTFRKNLETLSKKRKSAIESLEIEGSTARLAASEDNL